MNTQKAPTDSMWPPDVSLQTPPLQVNGDWGLFAAEPCGQNLVMQPEHHTCHAMAICDPHLFNLEHGKLYFEGRKASTQLFHTVLVCVESLHAVPHRCDLSPTHARAKGESGR